jgi:hypothetical protein
MAREPALHVLKIDQTTAASGGGNCSAKEEMPDARASWHGSCLTKFHGYLLACAVSG